MMKALPTRQAQAGTDARQRIGAALLLISILLPLTLLSGCAGIVSGPNTTGQSTGQNPQTFVISGSITPTAAGSGATVTLSGAGNATATADASGTFTFTGLANGTYTVTPSHSGYSFNPTSLNVTISGASVITGLNFTGTAQTQTFSISGSISPAAAASGATVTLSGAATGTTTASTSGAFTFTSLANGAYTVTPSKTGYTFSPANASVTINGANVTSGLSFTATAVTYSVSGTISPTAGGASATVTLSGAATATTTTNSSGTYTFTGLSNGAYAVTPSKTGYSFSPASQAATINSASVNNLNFTDTVQTAQTYSISGTLSPTTGGASATVSLAGPSTAATVSNSNGGYSFSGLVNGVYTVTPANTGYTFSPANQSVTVNASNVSNVNFSATAQQSHTVSLTWTASTSTVSGYNVYRGTVNGGPYTLVNPSLISTLSFSDSSVQDGLLYYYVATAVDGSGNESAFSNQVSANVP